MRSLVVLALAVTGFVAFAVAPYRKASGLLANETRAVEEVRRRGRAGPEEHPVTTDGYEFRWTDGVLVARPVDGGVRSFATSDGEAIYEFDPALFKTGPRGAPCGPMIRYLALKSDDRAHAARPPGWKRLR